MSKRITLFLACIIALIQPVAAMHEVDQQLFEEQEDQSSCISRNKGKTCAIVTAGSLALFIPILVLYVNSLDTKRPSLPHKNVVPLEPCVSRTSLYYPPAEDIDGIAQMIQNNYNANKCGMQNCVCSQGSSSFCKHLFHTIAAYTTSPLGFRCPLTMGNIIAAYGKKTECPEYEKTMKATVDDLQERNISYCEIPAHRFGIALKQDEFFMALLIPILTSSASVATKQLANPSCVDKSSDWPWIHAPNGCQLKFTDKYGEDISSPAWVNEMCKRMPTVCAKYTMKYMIPTIEKHIKALRAPKKFKQLRR